MFITIELLIADITKVLPLSLLLSKR